MGFNKGFNTWPARYQPARCWPDKKCSQVSIQPFNRFMGFFWPPRICPTLPRMEWAQALVLDTLVNIVASIIFISLGFSRPFGPLVPSAHFRNTKLHFDFLFFRLFNFLSVQLFNFLSFQFFLDFSSFQCFSLQPAFHPLPLWRQAPTLSSWEISWRQKNVYFC